MALKSTMSSMIHSAVWQVCRSSNSDGDVYKVKLYRTWLVLGLVTFGRSTNHRDFYPGHLAWLSFCG